MTTEIPKTREVFLQECIKRLLDEYFEDRWSWKYSLEIKDLIKYFTDKLCDQK